MTLSSSAWGRLNCEGMKIPFEDIRRDLIRAIRKHRSQERLSKTLGYDYNQLHRWESGKTRMLWSDFSELCAACKVPLEDALFVGLRERISADSPGRMIELLGAKKDRTAFASLLGTSRFTVSRWISGKSEPTLDDLLRAIHYGNTLLPVFLEKLIGIQNLPSYVEYSRAADEEVRISREFPWISAIMTALDLKDAPVARDENLIPWLAGRVRLPPAQTAQALELMKERGLIVEKEGRFVSVADSTNPSTAADIARDLIAYWTRVAAQSVQENYPDIGSMASFSLMGVTQEGLNRIRMKYREFWNEVAIIAQEDRKNPSDTLLVFVAGLCDLKNVSHLPPPLPDVHKNGAR